MRRLLFLLALLALCLPACGGDDEPTAETTVTERTAPVTTVEPETVETVTPAPPEPQPTETVPPSTDGGTPAPQTETVPQDTPENDVPPPPDSPAERFEQECERNPESCG